MWDAVDCKQGVRLQAYVAGAFVETLREREPESASKRESTRVREGGEGREEGGQGGREKESRLSV